jgi:hypothetical protein
MKSVLCFCIPFALLLTGSAQPQFNRPHPLYSGQQQYNNNHNNNNNLLALALLFGFGKKLFYCYFILFFYNEGLIDWF